MSLSTEEALTETLLITLEQSLAKDIKTAADWDRYFDIRKEAAARVDDERTTFRTDYNARLADAREIILRKHTGRMFDHPKPNWAEVEDLPSADKIDLLARNLAQRDHEARIACIRKDQADQYKDLGAHLLEQRQRQAAHAKEQRRGHAENAMTTSNQLSPHDSQSRTRSGPTRT